MVRIRMQRLGRKNHAFFRINAIDKRTRRDGVVIENLGFYDPLASDPAKALQLNADRIKYWLSVGAQPSETVLDFLVKADLVSAKRKTEWEADRAASREIVAAKKAAAAAAGEAKEEKKA